MPARWQNKVDQIQVFDLQIKQTNKQLELH